VSDHTMKAYGGVEVYIHSFFISSPDGDDRIHASNPLAQRKKAWPSLCGRLGKSQ
jgi:hypothetical protein